MNSEARESYRVYPPVGEVTPLIVEVPHAGLFVDPESLATLEAPAYALARDADLYVDELYQDAPQHGATLLVSTVSRYVCDLNRAETDIDPLAVATQGSRHNPFGLIWRLTTDQRPALRAKLTVNELERRLELFYRPYHRELTALIEQRHRQFGFVLLLSAHSMPTLVEAVIKPKADVVPGSRGATTVGPEVLALVERLARDQGWTVAHDDPYKGGFTTARHGQPEHGYHAIQLELARKLYMDEHHLAKTPGNFEEVRRFCSKLVNRLARLAL